MKVWITGYHGFLREATRLFVDGSDEAEPYFLFRATNCHFSTWVLELKLHKGQGVHVIWAEKSSVNEVCTLKSPLCSTSITMKMNWPFCFYLNTILRVFFCQGKTANLVGVS